MAVYNAALSAVGTKTGFTSTAQPGVEIEMCNLWYAASRNHVLRAAFWPEVSRIAKLVVAVTRDPEVDWAVDDPPPGYLYSYAVPADMHLPRYMTDFSPFELGKTSTEDVRIYSNADPAILVYTKHETDDTEYEGDLLMCIIYALAANICVKLTGKVDRAKRLQESANQLILNARLTVANIGDNQMPDWVAPWHAARGVPSVSESRYIFPYGPLINVAWF
jgi:hypothetical protein